MGGRFRGSGVSSKKPMRSTDDSGLRKLLPLRTPTPLAVRADEEGRPVAVGSGGGARRVIQIRESWRIDDEWWREPVSRLYFEVVLENGRRAVLYRDLVRGGWCRQGG